MPRYQTDFIEQEELGRGGFGVVVAALNRLDGRRYAVKKILMHGPHALSPGQVLGEVSALSGLQHGHIVRYFQAWREWTDADAENIGADATSSFWSGSPSRAAAAVTAGATRSDWVGGALERVAEDAPSEGGSDGSEGGSATALEAVSAPPAVASLGSWELGWDGGESRGAAASNLWSETGSAVTGNTTTGVATTKGAGSPSGDRPPGAQVRLRAGPCLLQPKGETAPCRGPSCSFRRHALSVVVLFPSSASVVLFPAISKATPSAVGAGARRGAVHPDGAVPQHSQAAARASPPCH